MLFTDTTILDERDLRGQLADYLDENPDGATRLLTAVTATTRYLATAEGSPVADDVRTLHEIIGGARVLPAGASFFDERRGWVTVDTPVLVVTDEECDVSPFGGEMSQAGGLDAVADLLTTREAVEGLERFVESGDAPADVAAYVEALRYRLTD